jgi:probable F420-dependent oxidoreductase
MALKDNVGFGMSLPHRTLEKVDMKSVKNVAQRSEALGFKDLWVTENTTDRDAYSFDPITILTYTAAVTDTIGVGVSVSVLPERHPIHVAHAYATLDYASGGRAILGVGIGRAPNYAHFGIPQERRIRRFNEQIQLIRRLWKEDVVDFQGEIFHFKGGINMKPVQDPLPIWLGGTHPDAVRRAAQIADGWMGAGGQNTLAFRDSIPVLKEELERLGRDVSKYPISKRVFMSVHENARQARDEVERWYTQAYHNPAQTDAAGVHGTPEQVREQLETMVGYGANHLLLNPVARYDEQVEALAEVVGLK